jgi:cation diffusion facilitator family transporter
VSEARPIMAMRLAIGSIAVGLVVFALKVAAWWLSGSIALYADALESLVNIATAGLSTYVLWLSAQPPDARHPYGHQKAEYISAVLEGMLIVAAAFSIIHAAANALSAPGPLGAFGTAALVNLVAALLNAVWARLLLREAQTLRSPALKAEGHHLMADVWSSGAVLAGLALAWLTGLHWLDPMLALLVAGFVLLSGWQLIKGSVGGLMDESVDAWTLDNIRQAIDGEGAGSIEAHDIRTRRAARLIFIEFHLVVPSEMTVLEAHGICDRIEARLKRDLTEATITIHVEPAHKAKGQLGQIM